MAIEYEVGDGIAHLTFCRPEKHNALRDEDLADLVRALARFDRDDDALVAILSGRGPSFSSGGDVNDRPQRTMEEGRAGDRTNEADAFSRCENWKPVIAAVHGYCLGHALGTAQLCDLVVASRDAVFQLTEVTIGLPSPNLWHVIHPSRPMFATEVALTGRFFTAEEAWEAGMLTRLVDAGEHIRVAEELAHQIMANPQAAVREQVRIRRSLAAEQAMHVRSVTGNAVRMWTESADARQRIAGKLARGDAG